MMTAAELNPIVMIPARLGSTRLPNKVLVDIHGTPLIVHVLRRAEAARVGPVVVACAESEVAAVVKAAGGTAILTDPDLPSGSDRIAAALKIFDKNDRHRVVINLQGDLPTIAPETIKSVLTPLQSPGADIATLAAIITREEEKNDPNVVKAVVSFPDDQAASAGKMGRALYFTRSTAPSGTGPFLHHIGIYAYRRECLTRFISLPPSGLEKREKLEQLRALEAGMHIDVTVVDAVPLGVDTPDDLARARQILKPK